MQFIDDVLDFTSSSGELGKPNLNDVKSGVVTAPVLFAAEEHPELIEMIQRKFRGDEDVARANELVFDSKGIQRTRNMANEHCELAADTVSPLLQHCFILFVWCHVCREVMQALLLRLCGVCRLKGFLTRRVHMQRFAEGL